MWNWKQADRPLERELISMVSMDDLGNALIGNLKLSTPGLQEFKKAEREKKKLQKQAINRNINNDEWLERRRFVEFTS